MHKKKKLPESLKKTSVHKFPMCDENESRRIRIRRKKRRAPKIFLMEGRVYKARAENSCHGYQTTSGQRFFIH